MTFQIFSELMPSAGNVELMYTAPGSGNLGVKGQVLIVNQGNAMVNSGNLEPDYGRDMDFVRIAISPNASPSTTSWISYDTMVPQGQMAQWQDICLETGENMWVYSQKGQTSFVYTGSTFSN